MVVLLLFVAAPAAAAQSAARADSLRIYLLTMGPGDAVWEQFGHNAIWVHDPEQGTDLAYNYGMFSFDEPGFFRRFLKGDLRYWMEGFDAARTVNAYAAANRSVWAQELNLTQEERVALRDFLEWNARPENRVYAYDYYRDNCSTRVRDAIDRVLGGAIARELRDVPTGTTYREHTRRLVAGQAPLYFGLQLTMGHPIDVPISAWEETFLPMELLEHMRGVRIERDGVDVPLVAEERLLFGARREPAPGDPPRFWPLFLALGVIAGGVVAVLGWFGTRQRGAAWAMFGLSAAWALLVGVLGTIIVSLWLFTDHYPTYRNENVLQANPLSLLLLAAILAAAGRGAAGAKTRALAAVVAGLSLLGALAQLLPGLDQGNGDVIALLLPVHAGVAAGLWLQARGATGARRVSAA